MLKKMIALLLMCQATYSYANNCPQYSEVFNGTSWLESFNGWSMQNAYYRHGFEIVDGFKRVMVLNSKNNNKIVCEYQNSSEAKNYVQTNTFHGILGSNWISLPGGTALVCTEQDPLSCLFTSSI